MSMTQADSAKLASYERRYRDLAGKLAEIGWIASGSLALRAQRCSTVTCACHSDPARRHGPYWHFTAKVEGKTVNKRLKGREARLYEQWIANDRTVRNLLGQMRDLAAKAQAIILADEASDTALNKSGDTSPEADRPPSRRRSTSA